MVAVYMSRRQAAIKALRSGLKSFETYQPMPTVDRNCWTFVERPDGPGVQYAQMFAEGRDWIHHVEVTEKLIPVLVVSCFREEILEEIPSLFEIRPLTPELWETARKQYPDTSYKVKTPSLVADPNKPLPLNASGTMAPREPTPTRDPNPADPNVMPVASRLRNGATAICREVYIEMRGSDRRTVIDECVARGVLEVTAATQYSRNKRGNV